MKAIVTRLATTKNDHTVSWLPLYHDMGLSSFLISLMGNFPLTLIKTTDFMRNAAVWLIAITQQRATLTHAPASAYALLNRQKKVLKKYPIELSSLRYASIGAEPLYAKHLDTFKEVMKVFGLKDNVLQPAYGLAESVVAVSFNSGQELYNCLTIDGDELHSTGFIKRIDIDAENHSNGITLVSNGLPLNDISIKICLENGELAQDNQQGYIWISGNSVTRAYLNNVDSELFQYGWFNTGDLGFIYDNEIYICGRAKDAIIRGGVTISPAYIEFAVESYLNLKTGRVVVFSVQNFEKSAEKVIAIIAMLIPEDEKSKLIREISVHVSSATHLQIDNIFFTSPNNIPKTTSGKVQRSMVKKLFLDGIF
jgi:acyl-CoA synthetase (AMP-forming)/AMP-acid ligase II